MALAVAALVEVLLVEVAPFQEGMVSMDLDSLAVLEVVLRLVGLIRVALWVVLWEVPVWVVVRHQDHQDHWGHQKEVNDGFPCCHLILPQSLGNLAVRQSILDHLLS